MQKSPRGELPPGHEGGGAPYPPGRAPCLVGPWWPSSTYSCTHLLPLSLTNTKTNSSTSSSPLCCHFRCPCSKHLSQNCLGDCSLVCDSSIGPISFCSSALFIAKLSYLGDHVLELACQIYMVPSSSNA